METLQHILQFILHLNIHLAALVSDVGAWTYLVLFLIIFVETGIVIFPFLPGDSLLFVAGSISAISILNVHLLTLCLIIAAILGNTVNYSIGRWFGHKLFSHSKQKFFKPAQLQKANQFYEKHGSTAIVVSRFLPVVRTFVPFIAGMATMTYARFTFYNALGAIIWVCFFLYGGYLFGQVPFIKNNLGLLIIGIIIVTLIPFIFQLIKNLFKKSSRSLSD